MKKVNAKLVKLASGTMFLVINGTSGKPTYSYDNHPVYHPDGFIYYPEKGYGYDNQAMSGKLFQVMTDTEVVIEAVPECVPAKEKYQEYEELKTECDRIQYGRFEQHPSLIKKEET